MPLAQSSGLPGPDPHYGGQLQDRARAPSPPRAASKLTFTHVEGRPPDGTPYQLASPAIEVRDLARGPLDAATRLSVRLPPLAHRPRLARSRPESDLLARADPDDADGDGISGRPSRVRDPRTGHLVMGRFGWKATQPSLLLQNATALREDLGVTSPVFPDTPCARDDIACRDADAPAVTAAATTATPEIDARDLELLTRYTRLLGPPRRRETAEPDVLRGEALFAQTGCARCHTPHLQTGDVADLPELAHQTIEPYTDLLLHDMGEALSDGHPGDGPPGDAIARERRTAPLWGIGLLHVVSGETRLLHDGRARTLEEAILWHGGEAAPSRDAFTHLPAESPRRPPPLPRLPLTSCGWQCASVDESCRPLRPRPKWDGRMLEQRST